MNKTIAQSFKMTKCLQIRKEKPNSRKQYPIPKTRGEPSRILQIPETPKPKGKFGTVLELSKNKRKSSDRTPENEKFSTFISVSPILKQSPSNAITWKLSSPISGQLMTQITEPCRYVPDHVEKIVGEKINNTLLNVWKTKKQIESQNGTDDKDYSISFKRSRLGSDEDERCNKLALSQIIKKPVLGFNPQQTADFTIFDDNEWPDEDEFQQPEFLQATQEMEDISLAEKKITVPDAPQPTFIAPVVKCQNVKANQTVQRTCVASIEPKPTRAAVLSSSLSERILIAPNARREIVKTSQPVKKLTLKGTTNVTEIQRKSQQCAQSISSISLSGSRNLMAQNSFSAISQAHKGGTIGVRKDNQLPLIKPQVNVVAPNTSRTIHPVAETAHQHLPTLRDQPKPDNSNDFDDLMNESFEKLMMECLDLLEAGGSETVSNPLQHASAASDKPATLLNNKVEFVNVGKKLPNEYVGCNKSTKNSATTTNRAEGKQKPAATSTVEWNTAAKRKGKVAENQFTNIKPKGKAPSTDVPSRNVCERLNMTRSADVNCTKSPTAGSIWPDDDLFFNSPDVLAEFQKFDVVGKDDSKRVVAICSREEITRKQIAAKVRRQKRIASRLMIPRK